MNKKNYISIFPYYTNILFAFFAENINKKITSSIGNTTPPHKIISSTPNSTTNGLQSVKKSRSSKPVASSTPDTEHSKTRKVQSHVANSPKKRNFSCDISPVTTRVNVSNNNVLNNSPRRYVKLISENLEQ